MAIKYADDVGVTCKYFLSKVHEHHEKFSDFLFFLTGIQGDIHALPFEANSFDIAIDKATMDALMSVSADVWDPPEEVVNACKGEVDEVIRVLKPKGSFIYLTYGQPHFRKSHLTREGWELEIIQLGLAFFYYIYIMKKTEVELLERKLVEVV